MMAYRHNPSPFYRNSPFLRPFYRRSASFLSNSSGIMVSYEKGEKVALKKIPFKPDENSDEQSEHYWENLTKLRDENLVQYRSFTLQDDGRNLSMELCQGSMLEYCRGTLDRSVAKLVKGIDIMWQITCAVDYLFRQKIGHGDLKLENVLFKKVDSDPQRVVTKLSGYGCNYPQSADDVKTDFSKFGCLYISAATKKEIRPDGATTTWNLAGIDFNAQWLAFELINLVIDDKNPFTFEAGTLLRHPFFIRYCQYALPRLINEQANEEIVTRLKMKGNLAIWNKSLVDGHPLHKNFSDLERILFSENKDIGAALTEASTRTPQLLSQYIWHLSTTTFPKENNISLLKTGKVLGKGSYGKVYECYYTNNDGIPILAACKKSKTLSEEQSRKADADGVYEREIRALSKLNHLFIIKYLGVAEMTNEKYIFLELCEGSLKKYVEGKLERVPKDSLDDKIIISQVALGLAYLHSEGTIPKDLKLDNILLKRQSPASPLVLAKITDFGFAKELKSESSSFSVTIHPGTKSYMAPELLLAPHGAYPANFASDVYSLGITIARIVLKGKHPFGSSEMFFATQFDSMIQGLIPPNLHHLSWDLIDLIIKLADKDPAKRPSMTLVLYHPYFILTNDKTKRHFVKQLWTDLSSKNRKHQMKNIFNRHNFQEWYRTITADKPETAKEKEDMEKTLQIFKNYQPDFTVETLYPEKQYEQKIKNALTAEYDANVGHQIEEISSNYSLFDHYQYESRTISMPDPKLILKEHKPENNDNSGKQTNQVFVVKTTMT
ncbi:uncharacterized protein LOC130697036 [Daphnia carinata]|uniref:uncharacterized protein LOC130697036 n=1 Tax=Daphnia carinata TaxID=120202 RepID=UPI00257BA971|nr:uncharacterized protein LOC130697036 [Daphnia carinata]